MLRAPASRRLAVTAVAVTAVAGIGWGAYTLGNAAGADTVVFSGAETSATTSAAPTADAGATPPATPDAPGTASAATATDTTPAASLTLDEAKAVALRVAPGRVVEIDDDQEATGLRYDVKIVHDDLTSTDVEVDATTGEVTSIQHDDDRD